MKRSGFTVEGHAEFAKLGRDTVCAAVSGIVQTAVLGILRVAKVQAKITRGSGKMELELPDNMSKNESLAVGLILLTMMEGIRDLQKQYPKNIKSNLD